MFTVTHDSWTHSNQSSCPKLERFRAANASSLAHQIANSSSHSFYAARSRGQIELGAFSIGSEMVDPPQKLPNDHADNAQVFGLANQIPELFEHGVQMGTVGEFESLAGQLIERFAQGPANQPAVSSPAAVLQSADEMEMAELNDPALARTEPDDSGNLVGDRGPDTSVDISGDRGNDLRPAPQVLPAWQEHRIEEDRSIVVTRLDRHQIQDPVFSSKTKINSVQEQDQRPCRQAQRPRLGQKPPQGLTTTVPHRLSTQTSARCQTLQGSPLPQDRFQKCGRSSPTFASAFLSAHAPCTFAATALTTSRAKPMDFGLATGRFRVRRIHARELPID